MKNKHRDFLVGTFALIAIACFGWLLFMFGDLPGFVSKMDANIITIRFPEVPGIQESSAVYFKGYPIGKVITMSAPTLRPAETDSSEKSIYASVEITIAKEYSIPSNIIPKIFQRGLGASYIELTLPSVPSSDELKDGMVLNGEISQGSEFISEATQNKLDSLIASLTDLSKSFQSQLTTTTPKEVDIADSETTANLTTAIMRLDTTLKSINEIVGSEQNQVNISNMLSDLSSASAEAKELIRTSKVHVEQTGANINHLVATTEKAVINIDSRTQQLTDSFQATAIKAQAVEDEMITAIKTLQTVIATAVDGEGSIDKLLNDPSLYESLTDTARRLTLALEEMQKLIQLWQENGVKMKL